MFYNKSILLLHLSLSRQVYVLSRCIDYKIRSRGVGSTQGADTDGLTGIQKAFPNIPKA